MVLWVLWALWALWALWVVVLLWPLLLPLSSLPLLFRVQPGGEGFVSQFEGKAAKPGMRSKQKHQITSLVYDLSQKEGDLLERQGKNFQTKKQTWGKYGWA